MKESEYSILSLYEKKRVRENPYSRILEYFRQYAFQIPGI